MSTHGMSEAGGLREAVEALAAEWRERFEKWGDDCAHHVSLEALLAAHPAPEADPTAGERCDGSFICDATEHEDDCFAATPDAGDAGECEDGVFGSQDIANALGGIGPHDASTNSEPLIVDLLNDLVVDCDTTERGHISVAMIPHIARILAAREAKARAEGAQIGLRAALDPGSFVPRGAAELAGEPFTERMDQWQRRAVDEGLARIAREVTR